MKNKPKLLKVWIEHKPDEDADTSHMGEYSNSPANAYVIDRKDRGDMGHNEYRYFNPSFNYVDKNGNARPGLEPHVIDKYVQEDYRRMEALGRGDWSYVGVIAKAEIQLNGQSTIQVLRSGGLWGVESDSGAEYLAEVAKDELAGLRTDLEAIGLGKRAITRAFAQAMTVNK